MSASGRSADWSLERYRDYLRLLARTQIGAHFQQQVDASDVVQETMLRAHARRDQFRGTTDAELAAWLRRVMANHLADVFRKLGRRGVHLERSLNASLDESSVRLEEWLEASQSTPSEHVMRHDQWCKLAAGLTHLPEDQRMAVELRHLKGQSVPEISQAMGRSTASVAGLLRRALKQLRVELDGT